MQPSDNLMLRQSLDHSVKVRLPQGKAPFRAHRSPTRQPLLVRTPRRNRAHTHVTQGRTDSKEVLTTEFPMRQVDLHLIAPLPGHQADAYIGVPIHLIVREHAELIDVGSEDNHGAHSREECHEVCTIDFSYATIGKVDGDSVKWVWRACVSTFPLELPQDEG